MGRKSSGGGTIKQKALAARGAPSIFESASISKKRHNVVGDRNRSGKARSTMQARARSDQIRRETLLIEHQQKGRTNAFVDGRFGEEDEGMAEEDKLVHRFQRERQRQLKAARGGYSLEDADEGGGGYGQSLGASSGGLGAPEGFTHGGVALDMDNLSDGDFGDSEDDAPKSKRSGRRDDTFEGADFVKGAHFGNNDDEEEGDGRKLTAKELLEETIAKYKLQKYERQEVRRQENDKIDELDADFDAIRGLVFSAGSKANKPKPNAVSSLATAKASGEVHDDFEKLAAELSTESKAAPADRLQTENEIASAEAKRLKRLEAERLRRMQPDGGSGGPGGGGVARGRTDDDLLEELMALAGPFASRQKAVLHRVIAGHHAKLREANKEKLTTLGRLLLRRMSALASAKPVGGGGKAGGKAKPAKGGGGAAAVSEEEATPSPPSALLQLLAPALYSIAEQLPVPMALLLLDEIDAARAAWRAGKQAAKQQAGKGGKGGHASLPPAALALLALCVQLFPLTDFRHVVTTPAGLLVQEVLSQPGVATSAIGVRRTLFLCSVALHMVNAAGRWMPELQATSSALLGALMARGAKASKAQPEPQPLRFEDLHVAGEAEAAETAGEVPMHIDVAAATLRLVADLATLSAALPSFVELFTPTLQALSGVAPTGSAASKAAPKATAKAAAAALPAALRPLHATCIAAVSESLREAVATRVPLRLQHAAPVALRQFNPAFDDDFQPDVSMDPDRERAEKQKLTRKLKKEKKGAIRELRKDGAFLATERQKEKEMRDAYLEGRGKRALALLETQEHEVKDMKKERRKLGGF